MVSSDDIVNRTLCDVTVEYGCQLSIDVIEIHAVHVTVEPGEHQMAVLGIISAGGK